jgi:4-aminobutyrate aminotransferase
MVDDLIARGQAHLTPALAFHTDIIVKKAEGLFVESIDGKRYMDFSSGLATVNIGHCPPEVLKAAREQMENMVHSGCIFRYASEVELAERLARITPEGIEMFFFSNTGPRLSKGRKACRYATARASSASWAVFTAGQWGR